MEKHEMKRKRKENGGKDRKKGRYKSRNEGERDIKTNKQELKTERVRRNEAEPEGKKEKII
jgi:hypothetical protein